MVTIGGNASVVVGGMVAQSSRVMSQDNRIGKLNLWIESDSAGNATINTDRLDGLITDIYVYPDAGAAPTASWTLTLTDDIGNIIKAVTAIDDADQKHEAAINLPICGDHRLVGAAMGDTKRSKVTLVLTDLQ